MPTASENSSRGLVCRSEREGKLTLGMRGTNSSPTEKESRGTDRLPAVSPLSSSVTNSLRLSETPTRTVLMPTASEHSSRGLVCRSEREGKPTLGTRRTNSSPTEKESRGMDWLPAVSPLSSSATNSLRSSETPTRAVLMPTASENSSRGLVCRSGREGKPTLGMQYRSSSPTEKESRGMGWIPRPCDFVLRWSTSLIPPDRG